jgi:hypothetical protein
MNDTRSFAAFIRAFHEIFQRIFIWSSPENLPLICHRRNCCISSGVRRLLWASFHSY